VSALSRWMASEPANAMLSTVANQIPVTSTNFWLGTSKPDGRVFQALHTEKMQKATTIAIGITMLSNGLANPSGPSGPQCTATDSGNSGSQVNMTTVATSAIVTGNTPPTTSETLLVRCVRCV